MSNASVLEIVAQGAWNGGVLVDNSIYEQKQLKFKWSPTSMNEETVR